MTRGRPRGFTLIEMLIVVAIVAILAAVAIPHFLEAQTRSKVSAAKANIRTLVSGAEAYHVDWSQFPANAPNVFRDPFGILGNVQLRPLTTPIAYVGASAFRDPFGQVKTVAFAPMGYLPGAGLNGDFPVPHLANLERSFLYFHYPSFSRMTGNPSIDRPGISVLSVGPDREDSFGAFLPFAVGQGYPPLAPLAGYRRPVDTVYDPTNGVLSRGDIAGFAGEVGSVARLPE